MRNKLLWMSLLGLALFATACGKEGPMGPTGPEGPAGDSGTTMIKEYTGSFATAGDFSVAVPEIYSKRSTTYVMVYWALSTAPSLWTPMSDGWKDDPTISRTATVSWTNGAAYFWGMKSEDMYLIQVFEHD